MTPSRPVSQRRPVAFLSGPRPGEGVVDAVDTLCYGVASVSAGRSTAADAACRSRATERSWASSMDGALRSTFFFQPLRLAVHLEVYVPNSRLFGPLPADPSQGRTVTKSASVQLCDFENGAV